MIDSNAYRPPQADLEIPPKVFATDTTLKTPRKCPTNAGLYWIKSAWHIFKLRPGLFIMMWLIIFLIMIALSMLPFVSLLEGIVAPIFTAGFVTSVAQVEHGKQIGVENLFAGFFENFSRLLGIGALYFIFSVATLFVVGMLVIIPLGVDTTMKMTKIGQDEVILFWIFLILLVYFAIQIPLMMLVWFAPVLIIQHDVGVWRAMSLSFNGCSRNILPFLVYSLMLIVLLIVAMIPLFLGLIIVFPLFMVTLYTAYKDIFLHVEHEANRVA